jgi:pimeloyl-ACP methyl ester carboxylesterase
MRARYRALKRKTREDLLADQRAEQPGWADEDLQPWVDTKQRFSPDVLEVIGRDNASGVDWPALLPRIACPALLMTADPERGAIVTEASAAALRALAPHLDVVHIPGAGHSIRRDQFDRYVEIVRGFLSRHQSAVPKAQR